MSICKENDIKININDFTYQGVSKIPWYKQFAQYILDPSSLNLPKRVPIDHPALPLLFQQSRDFCYSIDQVRSKALAKLRV